MNREKMKLEAISRLETLTVKYDLTPSILRHFEKDHVYYSYLTGMGTLPSIDTISYHSRYEEAVRSFEKETGCLVYHAIEYQTLWGTTLSLLFVGKDESRWKDERLYKNYILTYTVNFANDEFSELGDIVIGKSEPAGALIRL